MSDLGGLTKLGSVPILGSLLGVGEQTAFDTFRLWTDLYLPGDSAERVYRLNASKPYVIPQPAQLIQWYYQTGFRDGRLVNNDTSRVFAEWMARHGINAAPGGIWHQIIDMMRGTAPLDMLLQEHARRPLDAPSIHWYLDRAQIVNVQDRQAILKPHYTWPPELIRTLIELFPDDAVALTRLLVPAGLGNEQDKKWWMGLRPGPDQQTVMTLLLRGLIDEAQADQWLTLLGVVNPNVRARLLGLRWDVPGPEQLMSMQTKGVFDPGIVARWGLLDGLAQAPIMRWWVEAQGASAPGGQDPAANPGPTNWLSAMWAQSRQLPGLGEVFTLDNRLRPEVVADPRSPFAGVPAWSAERTLEYLRIMGYPDAVAQQLATLSTQPLNVRIIQTVLHEALVHPEIAAEAQQAFGQRDWVESVYLDHGFDRRVAKLASDGARAKARDQVDAPFVARQRELGGLVAKAWEGAYVLGNADRAATSFALLGYYGGLQTAVDQHMSLLDERIKTGIIETQLRALHADWLRGKLPADSILSAILALGVRPDRAAQYVTEWTWERTEGQIQLTTGEILASLKAGLMSPAVALVRLTNLGWNGADAMVEIALVEHELSVAQAKASAVAARQAQTAARADAKAAQAQTAKDAAAAAKAATAAAKQRLQGQLRSHEILLATDRYYAALDAANAALNAAIAKGEDDKANAERARQLAAYQVLQESLIKVRSQP